MRRRAAEFRRPIRRRFSVWIWLFLFVSAAGGLVLLTGRRQHHHHRPSQETTKDVISSNGNDPINPSNFTEELLSTTSFARQLLDQMTLAKAYVVIAKERGNLQLAWELSNQIRNCQRLLSQAAVSGKLVTLEEAHPIVSVLSKLIYKAQDRHYDISTTLVTLRKHVEALEDRIVAAISQSAEFGQLAAEAVPKNLQCLNIKLTMDWIRNPQLKELAADSKNSSRFTDNNLLHFCVFSDNILATSVVVNSTVSNADRPQLLVFHIVTNDVNYPAMKAWFLMNDYRGSAIEVRNVDDLSWLNASYSPIVKLLQDAATRSYYYTGSRDQHGDAKRRDPKFVSLLNHLRFYIPEIYPSLEKVVFLDDDVVVQKDLTALFSIDLHGKVNGAVETCHETSHRYYKYLNFSSTLINSKFSPQECAWAFGMNVFDLVAWRKANVTAMYHFWQEQNADRTLWTTGTLPAGLLTFYGLTEPLDRRWHATELGYNLNVDDRLIESVAVIHFDGSMKPWLKLGISRYRPLWERYLNDSHHYLRDCFLR